MGEEPSYRKVYLRHEALDLVRSGDIEGGIKLYREYLAVPDNMRDDDAWSSLGGAYRRLGNVDQATECYEKAYELNPRSTYAIVNLASLAATKGDEEKLERYASQAESLVREVIDRGKADHWTWFDLATLQLITQDIESAEVNFRFAADMKSCTAENVGSAISNLSFLKSRDPKLGLRVDRILKILETYQSAS